jgi:hypothetical protein
MMIMGLFFSCICLLPILRGKFVVFWIFSFLSKKKYEKQFHNMLCLMLDLRFKNLGLLSFFISHEKNVSIIKEYGK